MKKILFIIALSLFAMPAQAKLLYSDGFELKDYGNPSVIPRDEQGNRFSYNDSAPAYCVNPCISSSCPNCAVSDLNCAQDIGAPWPLADIPDNDDGKLRCRHSINIGPDASTANEWPSPIEGDKMIRFYIDRYDEAVKGHRGGRSEIFTESENISAFKKDRWFGVAYYFPDLDRSDFTYREVNIWQFKNPWTSATASVVPLNIKLDGGDHHPWDARGTYILLTYRNDISGTTPMSPLSSLPANRVRKAKRFVLRAEDGSFNDLGDWMYFVFKYHADPAPGTNKGEFSLWYASQDMINSCGTTGIECYMKVYEQFNLRTGTTNSCCQEIVTRIGLTYPSGDFLFDGDNRHDYNYDIVSYMDNLKISDGSLPTVAQNFAEVDPAQIGSSLIIRADVNQDSSINTTDAMLTLRNSLGLDMSGTNWKSSDTTGDVNCDNNSNSTDAMLILRYSVGLSMSGTGWCEGS